MIFTTIWIVLVVTVFGLAAYMEWDAIRKRISGANGLIFLVAGCAGIATVPFGFVLIWLEADFHMAWQHTLAMVVGGTVLWKQLLAWLDRTAKARR